MKRTALATTVLLLLSISLCPIFAQKDIRDLRWGTVIYGQDDEWYSSEEAIRIAENVLLYQRDVGGWPKNTPMHKVLSNKKKKELKNLKSDARDVTTDNSATTQEMVYLSKVYGKTGHEPYKTAFLKGLDYLLQAQYDNGGWPQKYPLQDSYSRHITYNDGSMVHIMEFLKEISKRSDDFSIIADDATVKKAGEAFEKGVEIILKTQYRQNGELTVWCAQHDEVTLLPAKARSYELPSLSGGESVGIVKMLMNIDEPSYEVIASVQAAVKWFEKSMIKGIRLERFENEEGKSDRRVIEDNNAPAIWARFNELEDNRPFFCSRDGIKKYSLAEISHERRNGYSWYTYGPQPVLDKFERWQAKWLPEETGYMFSYFTGNGEDGLHLAYSDDGLKWEALNDGKSFLTPQVGGDKLMRDPCIIRGGDGLFHMVWTVSWAEKGIGYANSADLVNWSEQHYIPVMEHEDSAMNCWAPELFYDEDKEIYMIYWASTVLGKYPETLEFTNNPKRDHRMYYVTTKDFKSFSETAMLYNQGFNVIDAVIVREAGEYVMLLKDETSFPVARKNIKIAHSKELSRGYGKPGNQISPEGIWVEGPSVMKSGDEWILYYDQYKLHAMGGMKSNDLENWTDISDQISFPEGTRHGTAFKVPKELYNSLLFNDIFASSKEEETFNELCRAAGETLFEDDCTGDWNKKWHLDGKVGYVENSLLGMDFHAGPEIKNDAHHAVLWTRETFSGDLMIEYDYTRLDKRDAQVNIIYIEATGSGDGEYTKEIFDWNKLRELPSMRTYYNNMNTLHISYAALSGEGDYIRARRYRPDVGTGLKGTDLGATYNTGFFETGVKHHITIVKKGYDLYMKVSNAEQTELYKWNYNDHPEITEGRIALRHMYSRSSRYSNFVVKQILPSFPGAEGFGAYSEGGRGGDLYTVTNLNDNGKGSLRYGIEKADGPRTIVFAVSGLIQLKSSLTVGNDYITIAGQTAPGDGICLRDACLVIKADHVIVRYIRSRLGAQAGRESDAISISRGHNIILDHCSASWSVDELFSCSTGREGEIDNVTVQWSIISEALHNSIHHKGPHGYGALIRGCYGARYTYHHNLFAHNYSRNPRPGNYDYNTHEKDPEGLQFDFRNNVMYNWGGNRPGYDADDQSVCFYNYIGNYAKPGPDSKSPGWVYSAGSKYFRGYFNDNSYDGVIPEDQWSLVRLGDDWTEKEIAEYKQKKAFEMGYVQTESSEDAYKNVLANAGANLPKRDAVDTRVTADVKNGTGAIINFESEVGGWPEYKTFGVQKDSDLDGMPDIWEKANKLDPADPEDRNGDSDNDGYTNLEEYINSLVPVQH